MKKRSKKTLTIIFGSFLLLAGAFYYASSSGSLSSLADSVLLLYVKTDKAAYKIGDKVTCTASSQNTNQNKDSEISFKFCKLPCKEKDTKHETNITGNLFKGISYTWDQQSSGKQVDFGEYRCIVKPKSGFYSGSANFRVYDSDSKKWTSVNSKYPAGIRVNIGEKIHFSYQNTTGADKKYCANNFWRVERDDLNKKKKSEMNCKKDERKVLKKGERLLFSWDQKEDGKQVEEGKYYITFNFDSNTKIPFSIEDTTISDTVN